MLNHAFLITAHAYFDQLEEIIGLLSAPNHFFFVNIDRKARADAFMEQCKRKFPQVTFLEGRGRMEVAHGGYSQIEVTLRLLSKAIRGGQNVDYVHLISGQDFPCQPNGAFDAFFEQNQGRSFMLYDTPENHIVWQQHKYPSRVRPYYFSDVRHRDWKVVDLFVKCCDKISSKFWLRKMIPDVYAGWNWFSWHRTVAEFVLQEEQNNPKFFRRFHHTQCCDEVIFHTLLHPHLEELRIDPANSLRYVNWRKDAPERKKPGTPLVLNEEEYDDIKASGVFFCRKVHPVISRKLKEMLTKDVRNEYKNK